MNLSISGYLEEYARLVNQSQTNSLILQFSDWIKDLKRGGENKLLLAGNGASASISSHLATDFSKQAGVRAMAFNDANLITALANDCGYDQWVCKALELYSDPGDIVILISSSGKSPNLVNAATKARESGNRVVAFTGFEPNNPLASCSDMSFWVDSRSYNIIECVHMIWLTAVCDMVIGKAEYSVTG